MRLSLIFLAMSIVPVTYAANFYTIIGPDGRPIIVQKPVETEKKEKIKAQSEQKNNTSVVQTTPIVPKVTTQTVSPVVNTQPIKHQQAIEKVPEVISQDKKENTPNRSPVVAPVQVTQTEQGKSVEVTSNQVTQKAQNQQQRSETVVVGASVSEKPPNAVPQKVESQTEERDLKEVKNTVSTNRNITEIDGVQYVNNEYLEDREFNLEGKKRFYVMPETGAMAGGRFETVEREKGLSKALLDRIRQRKPAEHKAIALATTYYRLPKEEVVHTLEQACFTGKKIDKAKTMSMKNQEVSFFPVAPIKENFAYEVVKLDSDIQNILFSSFASSQKKPSYYWPLAVFLDEKGCVVEGVSGFKNEEQNESATHHASLEGVLKKPDSARYLFMTPLSEAIDIQNHELTNQGQIKLSVIQ